MKHETLEKLCATVESIRNEPVPYDIWLTDGTANQLMGEANAVKLREGTLVLLFDDSDVVLKVAETLLTQDADYYVKVLSIGNIYECAKEGKKGCKHL